MRRTHAFEQIKNIMLDSWLDSIKDKTNQKW